MTQACRRQSQVIFARTTGSISTPVNAGDLLMREPYTGRFANQFFPVLVTHCSAGFTIHDLLVGVVSVDQDTQHSPISDRYHDAVTRSRRIFMGGPGQTGASRSLVDI